MSDYGTDQGENGTPVYGPGDDNYGRDKKALKKTLDDTQKVFDKLLKPNNPMNMTNIEKFIDSLGEATQDNEYILKPDSDGVWWLTHKHVGSGEPLSQALKEWEREDEQIAALYLRINGQGSN